MAEPYIGEIRIFPYTYAPLGWALCNGQALSIAQNQVLFAVIGTTYGGDGRTTFNLPNLQARAPLGFGQGNGLTPRALAQTGGAPTVTLTASQIPQHTHGVAASSTDPATAAVSVPSGTTVFGRSQAKSKSTGYVTVATQPSELMNANAVLPAGDSSGHNNLPPYLTFNFCIALAGVFPTRQ